MIDEKQPRISCLALRHFHDRNKPIVLLDVGRIDLAAVELVIGALDVIAAAGRRRRARSPAHLWSTPRRLESSRHFPACSYMSSRRAPSRRRAPRAGYRCARRPIPPQAPEV